jgi:hypothetical protein
LSYPNRSKGSNYGNQRRSKSSFGGGGKRSGFSARDKRLAKIAFESRSEQSQRADLAKEAPLAPNLEVWLSAPQCFDAPQVDQKLNLNEKNRKLQSLVIAKAASRRKVNVELKEPNQKKATKRYRIVKNDAKELEKVEKEAAKDLEAEIKTGSKTEEIKTDEYGRPIKPSMPTAQEIKDLAVQMFMEDQARVPDQALGETTPELTELREGGYLRKAQRELMQTVNNPAVSDYIESLKSDLEMNGYTIVPL